MLWIIFSSFFLLRMVNKMSSKVHQMLCYPWITWMHFSVKNEAYTLVRVLCLRMNDIYMPKMQLTVKNFERKSKRNENVDIWLKSKQLFKRQSRCKLTVVRLGTEYIRIAAIILYNIASFSFISESVKRSEYLYKPKHAFWNTLVFFTLVFSVFWKNILCWIRVVFQFSFSYLYLF